jgi:hypothetical protein
MKEFRVRGQTLSKMGGRVAEIDFSFIKKNKFYSKIHSASAAQA